MLALSHQHGLTQHTITMVAALSLQEVLLETPIGNHEDAFNKRDLAQIRHKWANNGSTTRLLGDPMVLLSAVYNTEYNGCTREFCDRHGLRFKAMQEIRKLRRQLANELSNSGLKVILDPKIQAPNDQEALLLRQILLAGTYIVINLIVIHNYIIIFEPLFFALKLVTFRSVKQNCLRHLISIIFCSFFSSIKKQDCFS